MESLLDHSQGLAQDKYEKIKAGFYSRKEIDSIYEDVKDSYQKKLTNSLARLILPLALYFLALILLLVLGPLRFGLMALMLAILILIVYFSRRHYRSYVAKDKHLFLEALEQGYPDLVRIYNSFSFYL